MEAILLRTLTEKSQLKFGKYADLTVREVINLQHPSYLRWCYFDCNKISFVDEILEELRIPENYRIEKPGKNPELGKKLEEKMWGRMHGLTKHITKGITRKERVRKLARYSTRDSLKYSKIAMQRKHHGHR